MATKPILHWSALIAGSATAYFLGRHLKISSGDSPAATAPAQATVSAKSAPAKMSAFAQAAKKLTASNTESKLLTAPELKAWFEALEADSNSTEVWEYMRKWSQQDPAGAWSWLITGGKRKLASQGVESTIMSEWIKKDPEAAISALKAAKATEGTQNLGSGGLSSALDNAFFILLASDDLSGAALNKHLDALADLGAKPPFFRLNGDDGEKQIQDKAAKYLTLPEGKVRTKALAAVAGALAQTDFGKAQAWIATLPPADQAAAKRQAVTAMLHSSKGSMYIAPGHILDTSDDTAAETKFKENSKLALSFATEWMKSGATAEDRSSFGSLIAKKLAEQDPAAALKWSYENLSGSSLSKSISGIIAEKAKADLPSAKAMVEALPPGQMQVQAATSLAKTWVETDPDAALPWLLAMSKQANNTSGITSLSSGINGVASTWGFQKPDQARAFLAKAASNTSDPLPASFIEASLRGMAGKEPQPTAKWASELPLGEFRDTALTKSVGTWASKAPKDAMDWLTGTEAPANLPTAVYGTATKQWFQRDPAAAVQWASQIPSGVARTAVMEQLKTTLEKSTAKPEKLSQWKTQLGLP